MKGGCEKRWPASRVDQAKTIACPVSTEVVDRLSGGSVGIDSG